jgi:hypothetical protein
MITKSVRYKRGQIDTIVEGDVTRIVAYDGSGQNKEVVNERAARAFINQYNGHKNWTHWNVSLWLNNDEGLYRAALDYKKRFGARLGSQKMLEDLPTKTPDGATYSATAIQSAMRDMG